MSANPSLATAFQDKIPPVRDGDSYITYLDSFRPRKRTRVRNPSSSWVLDLEDRFEELTALPVGWDGYSGRPVSFTCAQFAANLVDSLCVDELPAPQLIPSADGSLRLEWHLNQFDVEIDVLRPYQVLAYRYDLINEKEDELEIQTDFSDLSEWISEMSFRNND